MESIYWLIPLTLAILAVFVWLFIWSVNSRQYDDPDSAAMSILFDDDENMIPGKQNKPPSRHREESTTKADLSKEDTSTNDG